MGKKKIQKKKKGEEPEVKVEGKKKAKTAPKKEPEMEPGLRGIVRIAGKDIRGNIKLYRGLLRVRGVSHTTNKVFANIIARELGVSHDEKVGKFSDEQIEQIDQILNSIHSRGVPPHLLNRRRSPDTGKDSHVIMNDLAFSQRQDIEREKKLYTWKGYRHAYGKKVRGQRTRNTGRKGMALGVLRKTILAAAGKGAPAAGEAQAAKEAKAAPAAATKAAPPSKEAK